MSQSSSSQLSADEAKSLDGFHLAVPPSDGFITAYAVGITVSMASIQRLDLTPSA